MSAIEPQTTRPAGSVNARGAASARDVPPAIQWDEGMLLAPQHFQSLAARSEMLLHYHAGLIAPYHWGLTRLEIDRDLLATGVFRVTALEAVMPDGLLVRWPRPDAGAGHADAALSVNLEADLRPKKAILVDQPLRIRLAVAARGRGTAAARRYDTRYETGVRDEHGAACEVDLAVLEPKLQLTVGDDPDTPYVHFPLAEVRYRNEVYESTGYVPPWLRVLPGSALFTLCDDVATRLRDKAYALAGKSGSSARAAQLAETRALVHSLVGGLPLFEAVLHTGRSHPHALYLAFCSVLGHVAGFGASLVPGRLEPYDHDNLFATFAAVRTAIQQAVQEGKQEAYDERVLARTQDQFAIRFDPAWAGRPIVLAVRAPSGASDAEMAEWLDGCVVGGRSQIDRLRDVRRRGLVRKPFDADSDLAPSRGVSLYSLLPDETMLSPGEELVIFNPDQAVRRPQEIVLYVRSRV